MNWTWTPEIVRAIKENEIAHGLLKANQIKHSINDTPTWKLIEQAKADGADIEYFEHRWKTTPSPYWRDYVAYRVSPTWTPPKPKTLEAERREFMTAAFARGNVVRFAHSCTIKNCPFRKSEGVGE